MIATATIAREAREQGYIVYDVEDGALVSDGPRSFVMDSEQTILLDAEGNFSLVSRSEAATVLGLFPHEGVGDVDLETREASVECRYCCGPVSDETCPARLEEEA